ncbi:MAG TPA: hypothetical protein GXZ48_01275 [Acholeplasmataceae bacterium]|nr:hypothetical protein [Acholeplasmataceae bacterium]
MTMWKKGKLEIQKYYNLKLNKKNDLKSLIFGMILTLLVILPFLLILIQLYNIFYYHLTIRDVLLIISWFMLLLANGLSNLFMVKLAKSYYPDYTALQEIDDTAIFIYETFNIGFAIFTLILIIMFRVLI